MAASPRLIVVGLDCAEPSLLFEKWRDELPTFNRLMNQGTYGRLESCIPAITVPAWSCMTSGRDPGELGVYGFRRRSDRGYQKMTIANGDFIKFPRLWNYLSEAGWQVVVLSVPGTYPAKIVNGALVSGCLTPDTGSQFTQPSSLGPQLASSVNRYLFDVPNFRSGDQDRILRDIYALCNQTFTLSLNLLDQYEPDLLFFVELGLDRLHHALWKQMDPRHPLHEPDSPNANAIHDYYCHLDRCLAKLLERCPDSEVLVVSDHGAQPLMGGFALNQWLIEKGYLVLKETPTQPIFLEAAQVDWSRTKAWGAGGYYGRVFLNVQGREPEGCISFMDYQQERETLRAHLEDLQDPTGQSLGVKAHKPQEIYQQVRGIAPDLVVYFQNLAWRSLGSVGLDSLYHLENDTGPDDANHAQYGLMIHSDHARPGKGEISGAQIYDILPTLLNQFDLPVPRGLRGKILDW
ncbi:MAG: alkaline phosphatase family protein [Cyanobacteria bacterium P01_H01_bin.15]